MFPLRPVVAPETARRPVFLPGEDLSAVRLSTTPSGWVPVLDTHGVILKPNRRMIPAGREGGTRRRSHHLIRRANRRLRLLRLH